MPRGHAIGRRRGQVHFDARFVRRITRGQEARAHLGIAGLYANASLHRHRGIRGRIGLIEMAGVEQRQRQRRARVDAVEIQLESRVAGICLAQIGERFQRAILRLAQARTFRQRIGARRLVTGQQHLFEQLPGAREVAQRAQLAGDQHARALDVDAIAIESFRVVQVIERQVVAAELGGGVAGEAQRGGVAGRVARTLVERHGAFDGRERPLQVAGAELDGREGRELRAPCGCRRRAPRTVRALRRAASVRDRTLPARSASRRAGRADLRTSPGCARARSAATRFRTAPPRAPRHPCAAR